MAPALFLAPLFSWLLGSRGARLGGSILIVTLVASVVSLLAYAQAHLIDWRGAVSVAVASVVGSLVGSLPIFLRVRSSRAFRVFVAAALVVIGLWTLAFQSHRGLPPTGVSLSHLSLMPIVVAGFMAGLFAALANASGILIVPALFAIARVPMIAAQAISLAALAIVSALPAAGSVAQQRYASPTTLWCAFGAALGSLYGARLAVGQSEPRLLIVYGAGLIAAALVIAHALVAGGSADRSGAADSGLTGSGPGE